jgi:hypothetical protein
MAPVLAFLRVRPQVTWSQLPGARQGAEGLAQRIALLEDELAGERRAQEVSEGEHQAQFKVLTPLQT